MDGHFVPNLTLSLDYVRSLKQHSTKPIDVHLMVTDPEKYIDELIEIGVACISFHLSTVNESAFRIIRKIKDHDIKVGLAISPSESIENLLILLPRIDKVTVMTVEPGFAGQKMIEEVLPKISQIRDLKKQFGHGYKIEIDGSNNFDTFRRYIGLGAEVFILGTCLFNYPDLNQGFHEIRSFINGADSAKTSDQYVLGMDIGGTFTRLGFVDQNQHIYEIQKIPTDTLVDDFSGFVTRFVDEWKAKYELVAISMGYPGIVDPETLEVVSVPNQRKLEGKDYLKALSKSLNLPIFVDKDTNFLFAHDVHALQLDHVPSILAFYVGTGFGNAIQMNFNMITGDHGCAGEIGHIPMHKAVDVCGCGGIGCVETLVSGVKLKKIHQEHFAETPFEQLFTLHTGKEQLMEFIHNLAIAITTEINLLDVTNIILGGGVINMTDFPRESLENEIRGFLRNETARRTFNARYTKSEVEDGVVGAGIYAFKKLEGKKQ
jgi:allose kinase